MWKDGAAENNMACEMARITDLPEYGCTLTPQFSGLR